MTKIFDHACGQIYIGAGHRSVLAEPAIKGVEEGVNGARGQLDHGGEAILYG